MRLSVSCEPRPVVGRPAAICFAALAATVVVHAALTLSGLATAGPRWIRGTDLIYATSSAICAVLVGLRAMRVRAERVAWGLLATALAFAAVANLLWDLLYLNATDPPFPSWADVGWIAYYPPTYLGFALLVVSRLRDVPRAVALDGIVCAFGLAALVAGLVLGPIVADTQGAALTVVVNLTYPIGDLMLLALCAAALALTRGRPGRAWIALIAGLGANAAADTTYLFQAARGTYVDGGALDILWVLGWSAVAVAAWQSPRPADQRAAGAREHLLPGAFAVAAVCLLAYGAFASPLPRAAIALAVTTIAVAVFRVALVVRDVQRLSEHRRLAESDELTGLLNRRGLAQRLEAALSGVHSGDRALSLVLFDLDHFKEVNDTLGHQAGDQLLVEVAARLRTQLPGAVLARLGGDEFVAIVDGGPDRAMSEAQRLTKALEQPVLLDGLITHTQASVGIASSPEHGGRSGDLLRHADIAMYRAKNHGTRIELYAAEGDTNSRQRLVLATELRDALTDAEQIHVRYQPQINVDTGALVGLEALVRWQHPRHGLLTPDQFLDTAEQHALMHELTRAVIARALEQQQHWAAEGVRLPVSVNVTVADLLDSSFPAHVAEELARCETWTGGLQLELTEKTIMREPGRALDTLERLGALGIVLSLDDFGTGYSSLAHLKRLPVAELKVDRSFVIDMLEDRDDAIIVRSTIDLGRSLGLTVVAEGVESLEHLERLRYFGCHRAQGYVISRALAANAVPGWILAHRPAAFTATQSPVQVMEGRSGTRDISSALVETAGAIIDRTPIPTILELTAARLRTFVPHEDLVVYVLDERGTDLTALYAHGPNAADLRRERFPAGEGITGAALREQRTRSVARTDLDPDSVRVAGTECEPEALVCCPITADGRSLGVLNVYRDATREPFSAEETFVVERFATVLALALRAPASARRISAADRGLGGRDARDRDPVGRA